MTIKHRPLRLGCQNDTNAVAERSAGLLDGKVVLSYTAVSVPVVMFPTQASLP